MIEERSNSIDNFGEFSSQVRVLCEFGVSKEPNKHVDRYFIEVVASVIQLRRQDEERGRSYLKIHVLRLQSNDEGKDVGHVFHNPLGDFTKSRCFFGRSERSSEAK